MSGLYTHILISRYCTAVGTVTVNDLDAHYVPSFRILFWLKSTKDGAEKTYVKNLLLFSIVCQI